MKEFLLSNQRDKIERYLFYLLALFLPTQLGKHFWPDFSSIAGIRVDYLSPTIYVTDILIFCLFILWLFRKFKEKTKVSSKFKIQNSKFQDVNLKLAPLFIFVLLTGVFTSSHIASGLYYLLKLLEMSFVAYYIAKFISEKRIFQKIITFFCIGVIFQSLLAIAQYFQQGSIGGFLYLLGERYFNASTPGIANTSLSGELILRPYGTFPHPNVLSGYLLIAMILIIFSINKIEAPIIKRLKLIALLLGTVGIFLTMSRVAILLWVLVVIYYFLTHAKKRLPIFIFIGFIIVFLLSPLSSRFTKINVADEAVLQRRILIESSVKIINTNPYFGVGLGNFLPTLARFQNPLSLGLYLQPVHNIFLLTASEIGLIGFGIFLWFLRKTFQRVKRKGERVKSILIAFSAILIIGLFDHYWLTLQQGQLLFAFILGLCWADSKTFKSPRLEKF